MELFFEVFDPDEEAAPVLAVRDTGSEVEFVGSPLNQGGLPDYLPKSIYAEMPERLYFLFKNPMTARFKTYTSEDTTFEEIASRVPDPKERTVVDMPQVDLSKIDLENARPTPRPVKGELQEIDLSELAQTPESPDSENA